MTFEWDLSKERANISKHGIDFSTAAHVFSDPNRIEFYDEAHSNDEDRYITIGLVHRLLTVIYTERKATTRIISARAATKKEKEVYHLCQ